jgi:hypothetical protein
LLLFGELPQGTACSDRLEAFVVHQTFATADDAWRFVAQVFAIFSSGKATALNEKAPLPADASEAWTDVPSNGIDTLANMDISKTKVGYHVRIYISRNRRAV